MIARRSAVSRTTQSAEPPPATEPEIRETEIYTLVDYQSGAIMGAFEWRKGGQFIEDGPARLRVERIDTPTRKAVPVIFCTPGMAADLRRADVSPPDVFAGMADALRQNVDYLMRGYHGS